MTPKEKAADILRRCWNEPPTLAPDYFRRLDKEIEEALRAAQAEAFRRAAEIAQSKALECDPEYEVPWRKGHETCAHYIAVCLKAEARRLEEGG